MPGDSGGYFTQGIADRLMRSCVKPRSVVIAKLKIEPSAIGQPFVQGVRAVAKTMSTRPRNRPLCRMRAKNSRAPAAKTLAQRRD